MSGAGLWGAHSACQVLVGVGARSACQVLVGVVACSACQALVLISAQRIRQSPVLVRHRQPGRGGPCKFPNFPSPQELRGLGRIGGVTTLTCANEQNCSFFLFRLHMLATWV